MNATPKQRHVWGMLASRCDIAKHLPGWQPWEVIRALAFRYVFDSIPIYRA